MRNGAYALALLFAVAAASPASAAAPPDTAYGGGHLVDRPPPKDFPGRVGDAAVALRTSADGTSVRVETRHLVRCGRGTGQAAGAGRAVLAADNGFTVRSRQREGRLISRVTVTGRIEGTRASGLVTSTLHERGRRVCRARSAWASVAPPEPSGLPVPAPRGALLGGVLRVDRGMPLSMLMRTTADAHALRFAINLPFRCRRAGSGRQMDYEPGGPIKGDGTFRLVQRYTVRWRRETERGRTVIEGRFVEGSVAVGTIELTSVMRSRRTRRVTDRCVSGTRAFVLAPL